MCFFDIFVILINSINKCNFRLFTGVHGGMPNNEYGGTLKCIQWRKSYRLTRPILYLVHVRNPGLRHLFKDLS